MEWGNPSFRLRTSAKAQGQNITPKEPMNEFHRNPLQKNESRDIISVK